MGETTGRTDLLLQAQGMSHAPRQCPDGEHVWSSWSTEEVISEAGERSFQLQRKCYQCPLIQTERAMIANDDL